MKFNVGQCKGDFVLCQSYNKAAAEFPVLAKKQIKCYKSLRYTERSSSLFHFKGFSKTGKDQKYRDDQRHKIAAP